MKSIILIAIIGCLGFSGCDDKPAPVAAPLSAPAADAPAKEPVAAVPEFKPEYALAIEESKTDPKTFGVTWSAKVNTGGWTMKTESVLVEEYNGMMAARIYVTLESPNPSDTVTQAVETLTGRHDAGATKIERVEFSVRRHVRGVKYEFPAGYAVVKNIKYPW